MDQEFQIPEDLYEREERCQKAIRTVRKALLMRLAVDGLMIWLVIRNPDQVWSWGLSVFVLLINTLGAVPLWQELQKQKMHLRSLIEQEEA